MKNKKWIILLVTLILLVVSIVSFIKNSQTEKDKMIKNDQTKSANETIKNILVNGGSNKVVSIENKENNSVKIELINKDNNKIILKDFKPQWTKPVQIVDSYTFKTDKDKYFIFIVNSYQKISGSEEWYDDIYIFNSKGKQVYGLEDELYKIDDFKNKKEVLKILNKLKQEGKL